jgi:hypothetical protein
MDTSEAMRLRVGQRIRYTPYLAVNGSPEAGTVTAKNRNGFTVVYDRGPDYERELSYSFTDHSLHKLSVIRR